MAASATSMGGVTPHFSGQNYLPSTTLKNSINKAATSYCSFKFTFPAVAAGKRSARRGSVISVIRCSSNEVSAETTASETTAESNGEASVEVRKEPPSLISALNVEKALRGIAITEVDHYGRLGLNRGCSYDQVANAYKKKVGELNNQGLEEEEELTKNLQLLKESYSVLSSVEERRLYDWSLTRSENPDTYMWPFEVDITQTPEYGNPPLLQEPEDDGPTRLVGYFILGWVVLSFALSIILNT